MIDENEVMAYVRMPACFMQGCSEDIVIFRADGGNHFTDYGIYEGMFLFFDRKKRFRKGSLSCYINTAGDERPKYKVSDKSITGYRHFGIGSDGLITIGPSDKADFRMRIYNADGSEAEMCGNGIRCVAKYVYDHKLTDKTEISVETGAGIKYLTLYVEEDKVSQVRVDMGEPILTPGDIPVVKADGSAYGDDYRVIDEPISAGNREWHMTCVSMGNPHAVVFVDDVAGFELEKYGPLFENHKMFPKRTNTEFVEILSRNEAKMRVWERGSAETWACGTGTCATVMACILNKKTDNKVLVHLRGGDLTIEYIPKTNHVFMTGPATEVFSGEIDIM